MCSWRELNPAALKFSGIYARLQHDPPLGTTPDTWVSDALKVYEVEMTRKSAKKKKVVFRFLHAWQILRYHSKWDPSMINQKLHPPPAPQLPPKTPQDPSGTPAEPADPNLPNHETPDDRPMGGKAAKRQRLEAAAAATAETAKLEAMQAATEAQSRRLEVSDESNRLAKELLEMSKIAQTEANTVAREAMEVDRSAKDLAIAQAKVEDCSDELSKTILLGLKSEVAARYH